MSSYREKSYFQWIYTGIGLSVFLTLVLLLFSFYFFSKKYIVDNYQNLKYAIELDHDAEDSDIDKVKEKIAEKSYYQEGSFEFLSKNEIRTRFRPYLTDSLSTYLSLPFKDLILFEISEPTLSKSKRVLIKTDLLKIEKVQEVYFNEVDYDQLKGNTEKITKALAVISAVLFVLSLLFLYNTINSAIYSRREIIRNQALLGASKMMIALPILYSSLSTILVSIFISSGLLVSLYFILRRHFALEIYPDNNYIIYLFVLLGFVVISVILFTWLILQSKIRFIEK